MPAPGRDGRSGVQLPAYLPRKGGQQAIFCNQARAFYFAADKKPLVQKPCSGERKRLKVKNGSFLDVPLCPPLCDLIPEVAGTKLRRVKSLSFFSLQSGDIECDPRGDLGGREGGMAFAYCRNHELFKLPYLPERSHGSMLRFLAFPVLVLLPLFTILGCSSSSPDSSKPGGGKATPAASAGNPTEEADKIFVSRCATCHGMEGKGDGPGSANLNPKPRNYTDKKWQESVTDEQIDKTIVYGGAAVGKSPNMPANPDLNEKPDVVAALRKHIRQFAK